MKCFGNPMKKTIRFIYFDIGGVLLDFREGHKLVAKKYGVPYEAIQEVFEANWKDACRGVLSGERYMAKFAKVLQLSEPYPDHADFWTDYFVPISQTHALVRELLPMYELGLLTNAEKGSAKHAYSKGLIPSIPWKAIVDSSDHGTIKPEARIYEIAEKAAGVSPEEIFFIDDVEAHITVAKSRGWQGIVFDTKDPNGAIKNIKKELKRYSTS